MPNHSSRVDHDSHSHAVSSIKDWVTVEEFCSLFPNIPEKTIKWQLTTRQQNGLNPHVQVLGKRRYISIQGYAAWLDANVGADFGRDT